MLVLALAVDMYWTDRTYLLPKRTFKLLTAVAANYRPDVVGQDGSDRDIFRISNEI